jgi:hypothetical protein
LWTKEIADPQVKSTYEYVLDLRERLESTSQLARENLEKASRRQAKYYNKSARARTMNVGDKILVLLPTDSNKLLMQWKDPFCVTRKLNKIDYQVDVAGKLNTFHVNLLKRYIDRENGEYDTSQSNEDAVISTAVLDCSSEEQEDVDEIPSSGKKERVDDVDINPDLAPEDHMKVISLLNKFADVLNGVPGSTTLIEHGIKVTTSQPIRMKAYAVPFSMTKIIDDEVEKMLELNVIESSESPYCSPVVIVKKKDNTFRFCVDFRALNSHSQFDAEPMPLAEEIFKKFVNHKFFSRLDLSKGYWQVLLTKDSKPKTVFKRSFPILGYAIWTCYGASYFLQVNV